MQNPEPVLLTCKEVSALVRLARSTIYVMVADGTFPAPKKIGPKAVRWVAAEVNQWLEDAPRVGQAI